MVAERLTITLAWWAPVVPVDGWMVCWWLWLGHDLGEAVGKERVESRDGVS